MTTERECIEALQEAADRLGESPTKAEYEELGLTPASGTIQRVMGSWNEAKSDAGLERNASRGSRVQSKPDDVVLPDGLSWTELSRNQRWHYKHSEWNTERTRRRRARLRELIHDYKAASDGCDRCGEDDPACLDFHHPPGVDKEMAVNKMVPYGYSTADIEAEMRKCTLLCGNCHAKEHRADSSHRDDVTKEATLRRWTYRYKRRRGCSACGVTDHRCLEFHHPGEKTAGVGEMIADSAPEADVRAEVEQCVVLCVNCHRKEHAETTGRDPAESDRI